MTNTIEQTALEAVVLALSQDLKPILHLEKASLSSPAGFNVSYDSKDGSALDMHYDRQVPGKTIKTPTLAEGEGFETSVNNYQAAGFYAESLILRIPEDVAESMFLHITNLAGQRGMYSVAIHNGIHDARIIHGNHLMATIRHAIGHGALPGKPLTESAVIDSVKTDEVYKAANS